eukprot:TRINITY_DN57319_c0_g1_i1.p1 TRINITY_DN57319_c0_g1~~TRINITY_DN57319_c0_g1_i1.p1  ORF type:complete len:919 (+),score=121.96 TRINITY_DN57319_c0_g1_i1:62-2758(+)
MPTLALQMGSIDEERFPPEHDKDLDIDSVDELVERLPEVVYVEPPVMPEQLPRGGPDSNHLVETEDIIDLLEEEVPSQSASSSQKLPKPVGLEQTCSPRCLQAWHRTEAKLDGLSKKLEIVQESIDKLYDCLAGGHPPAPPARYSVSSRVSHASSSRHISSQVSAIGFLPKSVSGLSGEKFASKALQKHVHRSSHSSRNDFGKRSSLQASRTGAESGNIDKTANLMSALRKAPILGQHKARAPFTFSPHEHGTSQQHFLSRPSLSSTSGRVSARHEAAGTLLHNPRWSLASKADNRSKSFSEGLDSVLPSEVVEEIEAPTLEAARSNAVDSKERVDSAEGSWSEEDAESNDRSNANLGKHVGCSWGLGDVAKLTRSSTARFTIKSKSAHFSNGSSVDGEPPRYRVILEKLADEHSRPRLCWDGALLVTLVFMSIMLPLQVAYLDDRTLPETWNWFLGIADVVRIVDVFADLMLPVVDGSCRELGPEAIVEMYVKSWLIVDVLAAWPSSFGPADGSLSCNVLRTLNLLKCTKLASVLPRVQQHFASPILSYLKFFYPVLFLFHGLACTWRIVNETESTADLEHMEDKYILDLYWVLMTITSVGYGDIVPQSLRSRTFSILVMLMSSLFCGFMVSSTGSAMKWIFDQRLEARVIAAEKFMSNRSVHLELRKNVVRYLRNDDTENSLSSPSKLLSSLSPTLQKQVSIELWRPAANKFRLFSDAPEAFLVQLAQALNWIEGLAGELLLEGGQVEEELVFVIKGLVSCITLTSLEEDDNDVDDVMFGPQSWFGERCLFGNFVREFSAVIESRSELAVLSAINFNRILALFPAVKEKHALLLDAIRRGTMRIEELACEPAGDELFVCQTQSMLGKLFSGMLSMRSFSRAKGTRNMDRDNESVDS